MGNLPSADKDATQTVLDLQSVLLSPDLAALENLTFLKQFN
ncbi:MAG: hypothetical protein V7K89_33950 [Nostoc sp.]